MKPYCIIEEGSEEMITELNQITWEAKSYWGYPMNWMELWRSELTIMPSYLQANTVRMALYEGQIAGWGAIAWDPKDKLWELGHLWVKPVFIGKGIGSCLFNTLCAAAYAQGIKTLTIVSDPHAKAFYLKMGAKEIGTIPSQPEGRKLPLLKYELSSPLPTSTRTASTK